MSSAKAVGQTGEEASRPSGWQRLPGWLQPRAREPRRSRWRSAFELAILIAVGLVLAIATLNDVVQQVGKDNRLSADIRTWRAVTGHDYLNITTENGEENGHKTRDVTCADTSEGPVGKEIQECLIMTGPVKKNSMRAHLGGYYLPPGFRDLKEHRYGCFGTAVTEALCEAP